MAFSHAVPLEHKLQPRSLPLGEIWSKFTSEVGAIITEGTTTTSSPKGAFSKSASTMITTNVPVPISTITVDTTVLKTSFVTVHVTTKIPQPRPTSCTNSRTCGTSTELSASGATGGQHTTLPTIVTKSPPSSIPSQTTQTHQSITTPSATGSPSASHSSASHKHAIIGGLSGAIAGLVLVGVLICFCLRRHRHPPREEEDESISEKGIRPVIARKWSQITTKKSSPRQATTASRSSTPDFDGGPIRVSLGTWPRPFAHDESFRESMGPNTLLRVTNPDPSLPATPMRRSSESHGGFLRQQRSALAAVLLGANRSRNNSFAGSPHRGLQVPDISVDPALSSECVAQQAPTPSFRSYSSVSSIPVVEQRPPEDPFLTPPDERDELSTPTTPRRPGVAPLQSAAGAAGRTLSHIGSALNPFRSKSHVAESVISHSRHSGSTFSSAGDPFKLDRPSIYETSGGRPGIDFERPPMPKGPVYEGT